MWLRIVKKMAYLERLKVNDRFIRFLILKSGLGPNRFILIRRCESEITKNFWFARCIKIFFLFLINVGEPFHFWFWFILIRFDFDSSLITIHPRIKIKTNQKSKVGESWFTHLQIIGRFNFESKSNQSESRITLVRPLTELINLTIFERLCCLVKIFKKFQSSHKEEESRKINRFLIAPYLKNE